MGNVVRTMRTAQPKKKDDEKLEKQKRKSVFYWKEFTTYTFSTSSAWPFFFLSVPICPGPFQCEHQKKCKAEISASKHSILCPQRLRTISWGSDEALYSGIALNAVPWVKPDASSADKRNSNKQMAVASKRCLRLFCTWVEQSTGLSVSVLAVCTSQEFHISRACNDQLCLCKLQVRKPKNTLL